MRGQDNGGGFCVFVWLALAVTIDLPTILQS